jgi:hypothetical protein
MALMVTRISGFGVSLMESGSRRDPPCVRAAHVYTYVSFNLSLYLQTNYWIFVEQNASWTGRSFSESAPITPISPTYYKTRCISSCISWTHSCSILPLLPWKLEQILTRGFPTYRALASHEPWDISRYLFFRLTVNLLHIYGVLHTFDNHWSHTILYIYTRNVERCCPAWKANCIEFQTSARVVPIVINSKRLICHASLGLILITWRCQKARYSCSSCCSYHIDMQI